jgi:hypothetical protein
MPPATFRRVWLDEAGGTATVDAWVELLCTAGFDGGFSRDRLEADIRGQPTWDAKTLVCARVLVCAHKW